ncbi:MAG: hypothetical protein ABF979_05625 [Gluconobacter sp.]|uniref:hypothetical protein n=1 Tax=Gluconobacter sp. TaxID=1876758 RepID=UPI0039E89849
MKLYLKDYSIDTKTWDQSPKFRATCDLVDGGNDRYGTLTLDVSLPLEDRTTIDEVEAQKLLHELLQDVRLSGRSGTASR